MYFKVLGTSISLKNKDNGKIDDTATCFKKMESIELRK